MAAVLDRSHVEAAERALGPLFRDRPADSHAWVTANGLAALGTELSGTVTPQAAAPSVEQLWLHEQVVETVAAVADVVPLRYGIRFTSAVGASSALAEASAQLLRDMAETAGCVELSVRMLGPGAGTEELASATEGNRLRAAGVQSELAGTAVASAPPRFGDRRWDLVGAYLVRKGGTEAFVDLVTRLDSAAARLFCTGPWPPYSFVNGPAVLAALAD